MTNRRGNNGNGQRLYLFFCSIITADGDCSHEIKRQLLLGRKVTTNLHSILKSKDITLPTIICLVKTMDFPGNSTGVGCHYLLWHSYMTTGKTKALIRQISVGKVMCPLFNMLSSLVIAFLPRRKGLLNSWLKSLSAMILEPPRVVCHCFHCFPFYLTWSDGTRYHDLSFLNVEF